MSAERSGPTSADVASAYRRYAPLYDRLFGAVLEPGRARLAAAVEALRPARLLEVGVGTGLLLDRYPSACRVTGVDLSSEMLAHARQRVADHQLANVELRLMDGEHLAFPDGSFDCVTLPYVLSVTPDPARLSAEVRRVCRPGGCILVLNHFSGSPVWWALEQAVRPLAARVGFRSEFGLKEHVFDQPWDVESIETVNLFGLSKLVRLRNG